jgi:hypothetical protein
MAITEQSGGTAMKKRILNIGILITALLAAVSLTACYFDNPRDNSYDPSNGNPVIEDSNANLAALGVSPGTLQPVFDPDTTSYVVWNRYNIISLAVTPTASSDKASVTVTPSSPVGLSWGPNDISIEVTAEDGTVKIYTVRAYRVIFLPETGQTTSYEAGDDGEFEMGVAWPIPRFTDNGDGTVTDNMTGLVWLKNANRFGMSTWSDALNDCNTLADDGIGLNDGSIAGDWRLPNIRELRSLIDYSQSSPALPNGHPFSGVQTDIYWSSTTFKASANHKWHVEISSGLTEFSECDPPFYNPTYYVWPVRSAALDLPKTGQTWSYEAYDDGEFGMGVSWPSPRFTDNGDGTVTDNMTGLVWLRNANRFGISTWSDALNDCNTLADDGIGLNDGSIAGDWRLPNIDELESLIDYGRYNPVLPNGHPFSAVQSDVLAFYWTSNTYTDNTDDAWHLNIYAGWAINAAKSSSRYVWPVRSGQ